MKLQLGPEAPLYRHPKDRNDCLSVSEEKAWNKTNSSPLIESGREPLIEALNLVPDFLKNLVSNNLLDALSGG